MSCPDPQQYLPQEQRCAREILEAEKRGAAIKFFDAQDAEHPHVTWTVYGLLKEQEFGVIASNGDFSVGVKERSRILFPPMGDRIFGMDIADQQLTTEMSKKLWILHGEKLAQTQPG